MSIKIRFLALCLTIFSVTGCIVAISDTSSKGASQGSSSMPVPAILLSLNDEQKNALQQAASNLLYGRDVKLNNNAFATSATLSIERIAAKDQQQRPIDGRIVDTKDKFIELSLWIKSGKCWLKRKDTDISALVEGLNCKAL